MMKPMQIAGRMERAIGDGIWRPTPLIYVPLLKDQMLARNQTEEVRHSVTGCIMWPHTVTLDTQFSSQKSMNEIRELRDIPGYRRAFVAVPIGFYIPNQE